MGKPVQKTSTSVAIILTFHHGETGLLRTQFVVLRVVEVDHMDQRPAQWSHLVSGVLYRDAFHELLMQGKGYR